MGKKVFVLVVETAAVAYLFYYVLATGGGFLAGLAASIMTIHVLSEWPLVFYMLGLWSGSSRSRAEEER